MFNENNRLLLNMMLSSGVPLPPFLRRTNGFPEVLKRTAIVGTGAAATLFGLSQLVEYRKTQVSWRTTERGGMDL